MKFETINIFLSFCKTNSASHHNISSPFCFVERHHDQRPDPEVLLAVDPGDRRRQAEEHRTADGGVPLRRRDSRRRNTDNQNF